MRHTCKVCGNEISIAINVVNPMPYRIWHSCVACKRFGFFATKSVVDLESIYNDWFICSYDLNLKLIDLAARENPSNKIYKYSKEDFTKEDGFNNINKAMKMKAFI